MTATPASPATGVDRLRVVDALRGFALFGILLANALYWSGWGMVTDAIQVSLTSSLQPEGDSPHQTFADVAQKRRLL